MVTNGKNGVTAMVDRRKRLALTLSPDTHSAISRIAAAQGRTMVSVVNDFLDEIQPYLNKKNVVGVRANMLAASIAFQKKDYENSKTYWLAAFASGKKSYTAPVCKYNAAVCCEELGDNTKAAEYYESASDAKDFLLVTHCLFSLGRVKEALNDFTGAAVAYNKLVDKYPDDEWTNVAQSRLIALKTEGKITDAVVEPTDAEKSTDKESK